MLVVAYREQDHDKLVEIWESAIRETALVDHVI